MPVSHLTAVTTPARAIPTDFWKTLTVTVVAPKLIYDGPFTTGRGLAPARIGSEYVYFLFGAADELLYIGRSFRPADRFTKHRRKPWWQEVVGLVLLRIDGADMSEAAVLTTCLEKFAIERLQPTRNITGIKAVA